MCDYKIEYYDFRKKDYDYYECPYRPEKGFEKDGIKYCIFHSQREDKDVERFYKEFKKLYKLGQHLFPGFVFPKDFSFGRLYDETGWLLFADAIFLEATFLCKADFSFAEFSGEGGTDFSEAKFLGKNCANFSSTKFSGETGTFFSDTVFSGEGEIHFNSTQFSGKGITDFNGAQFTSKVSVNFRSVKFLSEGGVDFSKAIFSGDSGTSFNAAKFLVDANFDDAVFKGKGKVDFSKASFSETGGVSFINTVFSAKGGVSFEEAEFSKQKDIFFSWAVFSGPGEVTFERSEFKGEGVLDFEGIKFKGPGAPNFWQTKFSAKQGVNFQGIEFRCKNEVNFFQAEFNNDEHVKFGGDTFFDETTCNFEYVSFKNPKNVIFDGVNLNRVKFIGTDLRDIRFKEIYWTNSEKVEHQNKRRMVFDETLQIGTLQKFLRRHKIIKKDEEKEKYKLLKKLNVIVENGEEFHYDVSLLYNQLRLNYEESGRYFEAGDFFIGSMEMRRRGTFESNIIRGILHLYKWISLYGERPIRALCWLVGLILLLGLIYGNIIGVVPKNDVVIPVSETGVIERTVDKYAGEGSYDNYLNGLNLSLNYLTFGKVETPHKLRYTRYGFLLQAAEVVFGAVFLSLFILAMNRKFRRMKD